MSWAFFDSGSTTQVALVGALTALTRFNADSNFSTESSGNFNSEVSLLLACTFMAILRDWAIMWTIISHIGSSSCLQPISVIEDFKLSKSDFNNISPPVDFQCLDRVFESIAADNKAAGSTLP